MFHVFEIYCNKDRIIQELTVGLLISIDVCPSTKKSYEEIDV